MWTRLKRRVGIGLSGTIALCAGGGVSGFTPVAAQAIAAEAIDLDAGQSHLPSVDLRGRAAGDGGQIRDGAVMAFVASAFSRTSAAG